MLISEDIRRQLYTHAREHAPLEACGYLGGRAGRVTSFYPMTNVDQSADHFSLDPREQFTILKTARARGEAIVAVYHSHPATPARPSQEDIRLAYDAAMLYVIVSLQHDIETLKAYTIRAEQVQEIDVAYE